MLELYSELVKYDEYRKGEPFFSWLPEFDRWVCEYFGVEFMPSYAEIRKIGRNNTIMYDISLMLFDKDDTKKFWSGPTWYGRIPWYEKDKVLEKVQEKAREFAFKYNEPILKENEEIRVVDIAIYKNMYLFTYLLSHKPFELQEQIKAYFSNLPVYSIRSWYIPAICVLKTKKDAKEFLLSDDYKRLKKQIYELLKSYDEYDVLEEDHIRIFVDYMEHMKSIPMYGRWVDDLSNEESDKHFKMLLE